MEVTWHNMLISLPVLLVHLAVTTGLFIGGVSLYVYLAPYRELELVREGNVAAAVVLSGQTLGLAIPLAAMMANSITAMGVGLWGIITIVVRAALHSAIVRSHLARRCCGGFGAGCCADFGGLAQRSCNDRLIGAIGRCLSFIERSFWVSLSQHLRRSFSTR
jgi:uncharacterized membrane protein YjfL (UPF0719 family)